jgi:hypothetical protein
MGFPAQPRAQYLEQLVFLQRLKLLFKDLMDVKERVLRIERGSAGRGAAASRGEEE